MQKEKIQAHLQENQKGTQLPYDQYFFFYTAEWLSPHNEEKGGRKTERNTKKIVHGG